MNQTQHKHQQTSRDCGSVDTLSAGDAPLAQDTLSDIGGGSEVEAWICGTISLA